MKESRYFSVITIFTGTLINLLVIISGVIFYFTVLSGFSVSFSTSFYFTAFVSFSISFLIFIKTFKLNKIEAFQKTIFSMTIALIIFISGCGFLLFKLSNAPNYW